MNALDSMIQCRCSCRPCLQTAPVDECVLASMRWGLVPSWFKEKDPSKMQYSTTNCRSENILEKKSYKVQTLDDIALLCSQCFVSVSRCCVYAHISICNHLFVFTKDPMVKGQRCVILADGFYEWKRQDNVKQPFFIYFPQILEKTEDQDDPRTSARNKENSESACPPVEASPDLTEVCIVFFYYNISTMNMCFHPQQK